MWYGRKISYSIICCRKIILNYQGFYRSANIKLIFSNIFQKKLITMSVFTGIRKKICVSYNKINDEDIIKEINTYTVVPAD